MVSIVVSLAINAFLTFAVSGEHPTFAAVAGVAVVIQILGALAIALGRREGAYAIIVAAIVFVPIGLIGAYGARRVLDERARQELEQRRALAVSRGMNR